MNALGPASRGCFSSGELQCAIAAAARTRARPKNRLYTINLLQHLVQQLPHGPLRFQDRAAMIHDSRQVGIRERDSPERSGSQDLAGRRLAVSPEEKSRLRIQ